MRDWQSLSRVKGDCKYHDKLIPRRHRKIPSGPNTACLPGLAPTAEKLVVANWLKLAGQHFHRGIVDIDPPRPRRRRGLRFLLFAIGADLIRLPLFHRGGMFSGRARRQSSAPGRSGIQSPRQAPEDALSRPENGGDRTRDRLGGDRPSQPTTHIRVERCGDRRHGQERSRVGAA